MTQVGMTSDISGSAIQVLKKINPTAVSWYWVGMRRSRVPNEILKWKYVLGITRKTNKIDKAKLVSESRRIEVNNDE